MNLSRSFTLEELTFSQTAARLNRPIVADAEQLENLTRLCAQVLQPLRDALGVPIIITSGLRPPWLNELVNGAKGSAHLYGRAADIKVRNMDPFALCQFVHKYNLRVDQCILEFDSWCHISVAPGREIARTEYITIRHVEGKGKVTLAGIVPLPKGVV